MSNCRLLYSSNAPWSNSGYGVQSRSLLPRLAQLPEFGGIQNIAMFAWYGLQGGMHNIDGLRVYPAGMDPYGNDIIDSHVRDFEANLVVSLIDVWVMRDTANKVKPALWLPWLPIDHDPIPESVINALQGAHLALSYSKWASELMTKTGIKNEYIPHGVEPSIYRVDPDVDKVSRFKRDVLRTPEGGHLTVMVAANKGYPDRKAFQVQMRAWAKFAKDKPDARLYVHTDPTPMLGGLDLFKLAASLGVVDKVMFPDRYKYFTGLPAEFLALVYNCADAFLGAAMSEGFGIPIIEAQACGVPVIVNDFSAMPELVRWGYKIEPRDMIWTPQNSWQAWPDHAGITDALCELHGQWESTGNKWPMSKRLQAQDAIHSEYNWDQIVAEQWGPLMKRLSGEIVQPKSIEPVVGKKKVGTIRKINKLELVTPGEVANG